MAQRPAQPGNGNLGSILDHARASLGVNDEMLANLEERNDGSLALWGKIDDDFDLLIRGGHGSFSQDKTTLYVTIKGSFEIKSPNEGTWSLVIKDGDDIVKQIPGAVAGKEYAFEYKTGFRLKLRIEANWSEKRDTTLRIHLKATY
jgi:hypothetical protein